MIYHLAASLLLIAHLAFVAFVVFGAVLVLRWPKLLWFHVAAVLWGVLVEFSGAICPLTPLEVRLRQLGGDAGYEGDFIAHYLTTILYPAGLTRELQIGLGFAALVPNVIAYACFLLRKKRIAQRHERPACNQDQSSKGSSTSSPARKRGRSAGRLLG
jgi:hypothetical protein